MYVTSCNNKNSEESKGYKTKEFTNGKLLKISNTNIKIFDINKFLTD